MSTRVVFAFLLCCSAFLAELSGADLVWTNAAGGLWSDATSWFPNAVPTPADRVFITNAGSYVVTLDVDATTAAVTVGGDAGTPTLRATAGRLSVLEGAEILPGGVLSLEGAGALAGPGILTNAGVVMLLSATNHAWLVNDGLVIAVQNSPGCPAVFHAPVQVRTGATFRAESGALAGVVSLRAGLTNDGLVELVATGSGAFTLELPTGRLVNRAGGRITTGDSNGAPRIIAGEIENRGELATTAPGELMLLRSAAEHENRGTLVVSNGNFHVVQSDAGATFLNFGSIRIEPGRTLAIRGGEFREFTGGISGGGALVFTNAIARFDSDHTTLAGGLVVAGVSSLYGPGIIRNAGSMVVQSSTIHAPVENLGMLTASQVGAGFPAVFAGPLAVRPGSVLRAVSAGLSGVVRVESGFTNEGFIEITVGGSASSTLDVASGALVNAPGGRISTGTGSTIPRVLAAELDNQGELITTATATLSLSRAGAAHRNAGTMIVSNGNLTINQSGVAAEFSNTGTIHTGAGRTLSVSGGAFRHLAGVMGGAGALAFSGARVFLAEDHTTSPGGLTLSGASALHGPGTVRNAGVMTLRSSTNFAVIENLGLLAASQVNNGVPAVFAGPLLVRTGSVFRAVAGGVHGVVRVEAGLTNEGTIEVTSESSEAFSTLEVAGGPLWNAPGGLVTTGTNATTRGRFLNAELRNLGALLTTAPAALTLNGAAAAHLNSGSLVVSNGDLIVSQSGASASLGNEGTVFVRDGRVMTVSGGVFENLPGGDIRGAGTLACSATLFTNRGVIHPGTPAGVLSVVGSMTTVDPGQVSIELGSTPPGLEPGRLAVSGTASLGGALSVTLAGGYAPAAGSVFTVLTAAALSDEFAGFNYPSNEYRLSLEYAPGAVNVRVIDTPPIIEPLPDVEVIEGGLMTAVVNVLEVGAQAVGTNFVLLDAPTGASIGPDGIISWVPEEADGPGVFAFLVQVTDGEPDGLAAFGTFVVTVREENRAPELVLPPDQTVGAMSLLEYQATATDADVPANPLLFELLSAPAGFAMSAEGRMTWKPGGAQVGVHEIIVRVIDENPPAVNATQLAATNRFRITVEAEELSIDGWRVEMKLDGAEWNAPWPLAVSADDVTPRLIEARIFDTNGVLIVRPDVQFAFPETGASMITTSVVAAGEEGGGLLAIRIAPNGVAGFYRGRLLVGTNEVAAIELHNVAPGLAVGGQLSDVPGEDIYGRARRFREFLDGGQSYLLLEVGAAWNLPSQAGAIEAILAQRALATRGVRLRVVPVLLAGMNSNAPSLRADALDWAQTFPFVDPVLHLGGDTSNALAAAAREILSLERTLPASLLVAPDGRILDRRVGVAGASEIIQRVGVAAELVPPLPPPASLGVAKSDELLVVLRVGEFRFSDIGVNRIQRTYGLVSIVADERLEPLPGLTNSAPLVDTFSLQFEDLDGLAAGRVVEMDFVAGWLDGYQRHLSNGVANIGIRMTNDTGVVSGEDVGFAVPAAFDGTRLSIRFTSDQLRDAVTEHFIQRNDVPGGSNALARLVGFAVAVAVRTEFAIVPAVRGQVLDNKTLLPLPGTLVRLSGPGTNRTVVADAEGRFQFTRLGAGLHSLTGTRSNFVFSAPSFTVSGTSIVITQNLSALRTAFDLVGWVTNCSTGAGVPNVPVYVSGLTRPLMTDSAGRYVLNGVRAGGVVQVQPSGAGEFVPRAFRLIAPSGDREVVNFCMTPAVTLSGRVRGVNGAGVGGVTVSIEDSSGAVREQITSAPGGDFRFDSLLASNYVVTPVRAGFSFAPPVVALTNLGAALAAEFVATPVVARNDRLAVADARGLHGIDGDGAARLRLPLSNVVSAAISPDGSRVVFGWYEGTTGRVSVIHADGPGLARLVPDGMGDVAYPAWAPDGAQVAFVRGGGGAAGELWRIGTNGTGALRLATNVARLPVSWSPDGTGVAFAGGGTVGRDIFTVGSNGGAVTRWTTNGTAPPRSLAWSPDGTRLAFVRRDGAFDQAYVLRLADRSVALLVSNALAVCWSPDGSQVAFRRGAEVFQMPAGGGAATWAGIAGRLSSHAWGRKPFVSTAKGSNSVSRMGGVSVTYAGVSAGGETSFNPITSAAFAPPAGYALLEGVAYEVATTASVSGMMTVCLRVEGVDDPIRFARLRVLRGEDGAMVDRTSLPPDFTSRTVCAVVDSLSSFVLAEVVDAGLPVISGLVVDDQGAPVSGAVVTLSGGAEMAKTTDRLGRYSFPNLSLGAGYSVEVRGPRHGVAPAVVAFQELDESVDLFFVGTPVPTPAAPLLRVGPDARFAVGTTASWPGTLGVFTLQSSATLEPGGWSEAYEVEVPLDGAAVVPIELESPWRFFRLVRP